jgi:hypothetical protein
MTIWNRFWNVLGHLLVDPTEPSITRKCDRFGHDTFQVYDPKTQKHGEFSSEQEIRVWLEQRHYPS